MGMLTEETRRSAEERLSNMKLDSVRKFRLVKMTSQKDTLPKTARKEINASNVPST